MQLNSASDQRAVELEHRISKVWPVGIRPDTAIDDAQASAIDRPHFVSEHPFLPRPRQDRLGQPALFAHPPDPRPFGFVCGAVYHPLLADWPTNLSKGHSGLNQPSRTALITGVTGQDGSYLAELLLDQGYRVIGMMRRTSTETVGRIAHLMDRIELVHGDLLDQLSLISLIQEFQPDEVYNLAAQSFVPTSWQQPVLTGEFTALGVTRMLEAIRLAKPDARFYQASSSEMFGKVQEVPQTETTPFYPRSPYGVSKVYGHWITVNYRESYDLFAASGILFNHESPRRGLEFVTRKISHGVALIREGMATTLSLGNLDAQRDWGFAGDYVRAMWLMLQQDEPQDFVVATGRTHTVRRLCEIAFDAADLNWEDHVVIDERFMRPAEVDLLVGNPEKAKQLLGWEPEVSFEDMVADMVATDIDTIRSQPRGMWPTRAY